MGNPKSFKISFNSPLVATIRSCISRKLREFLGNYSDDVLTEYITVLVCNGKHQHQARDDLEAFLGERSEEFVSWLWDLLLGYANQSNKSTVSLDPKVVSFDSPHEHDAVMEHGTKRSRIFHNHDIRNDDGLPIIPTEGEELRHPSNYTVYTHQNDTDFSKGFWWSAGFSAPLNDVNTEKVSLLISGNGIKSKPEPVEDIYDEFFVHGYSGVDNFSLIPRSGDERAILMDKSRKIVSSQAVDFPEKDLSSSKQPYAKRLMSSIADTSPPLETSASKAYRRSLSPKIAHVVYHQYEKSRVSVWDRLGKQDKNTFERSKTVCAHGIFIREQNGVLDQSVPVLPLPNEQHGKQGTPGIGNGANKYGKLEKLEGSVSSTAKLNGTSNIRQKRHFGESSTSQGNRSLSLVGKGNRGLQYIETPGDSKKSKLVEEVTEGDPKNSNLIEEVTEGDPKNSNLIEDVTEGDPKRLKFVEELPEGDPKKSKLVEEVSEAKPFSQEMLDLKVRFHQLQREMCKLRSKHTDLMRGGKPDLSSSSGTLKHPEEDIEARTVYITNVHFAATREALSSHFAKCGLVVNVIILTDDTIAQPNRSALITFASMESVNKALALSGTSFFSRIVKVFRKVDMGIGKSTAVQVTGSPVRAWFSPSKGKTAMDRPLYSSPHLQWRRGSFSNPSEPSSSSNMEEKFAASCSSQQLFPG